MGQLACLLHRLPCRLVCTCTVRVRAPVQRFIPVCPALGHIARPASSIHAYGRHLPLCLPFCLAQFNKLTEVAMELMDAGEADVYSQNKVGGLG